MTCYVGSSFESGSLMTWQVDLGSGSEKIVFIRNTPMIYYIYHVFQLVIHLTSPGFSGCSFWLDLDLACEDSNADLLCVRVEDGDVIMEVEEEETGRGCPDEWDDVNFSLFFIKLYLFNTTVTPHQTSFLYSYN